MANTVTIKWDGEEYRVPSADGREEGACYTDDREDAIGTATNYMYKGQDVVVKVRRGTWYD